ncbi:hypothetical protein [Thermogymnomonas acidicola]|nr:hypothetical protein [Thermogymnomonas acidicola]
MDFLNTLRLLGPEFRPLPYPPRARVIIEAPALPVPCPPPSCTIGATRER